MATKKVLFALSLALFINPALHCMENTDKKIVYMLGGLSVFACTVIILKNIIKRRNQEFEQLVARDIEVFTSGISTDPYQILEKTNRQLCIYSILNTSTCSINQWFGHIFSQGPEIDP